MKRLLFRLSLKTQTQKEFRTWQKQYSHNKFDYTNFDLWQDVGEHPLDILFMDLAKIYQEASNSDRKLIEKTFENRTHHLWQLIIFIRRLAILVISRDQLQIVQFGLAITLIEGGHFDPRDAVISLVILKFASQRAGINIDDMIDQLLSLSISKTMELILRNVRNHHQADIVYSVKEFGPPNWFQPGNCN